MNFIQQRFLQYFCLFLIAYSFIGGMVLPLSPNIEQINYVQENEKLKFSITTPKLTEDLDKIYLKQVSLGDTATDIIYADSILKTSQGYNLYFQHPNTYLNFQKGDVFDLVAHTKTWGALRSYSAFYLDSVKGHFGTLPTQKIDIPEKQFHLSFPNRNILRESIRNLYYHVPMWFTMIALLIYSLVQSILYLSRGEQKFDDRASLSARVAMIFGIMGLLTGMIWAKHTWGAYWTNDPKLNGTAIGMLAYFAYFILRGSIEDDIKKAKLSAVYNIFSFTIYMVFIMVLPRIHDSLHPGNGGNPGFNIYEQDNIMRLFFYPAVIGWIFLGFWLTEIYVRIKEQKDLS